MDAARAMDEMLARAADAKRSDRVLELHAAFEARTGTFSPRDSFLLIRGAPPLELPNPQNSPLRSEFFEARSAAFWDDALTSGAFGRELLPDLSAEAAAMVEPFVRAHRGLFRVEPEDDRFLLVDEWSGAELVAEPASAGLRDALERVSGLVDGRVVGVPVIEKIVLLPGAVFHAADAIEPIRALLPEARARKLETPAFLDALLRMDHALRALSRVKPAFAYRKEALPK